MAIRIIDGKPGSGKSFYAVNHLLKNYYKEDREIFIPDKEITLISNIDGLKLKHIDLKTIASQYGGYDVFFSHKTQEQLKEKYGNIIYVIDEAQKLFRKNYKNDDVFFWFEYHRHLGQDIYLLVQNIKKLAFDIHVLAEYSVYACPRIRSMAGEFRYKWMDENTVIKTETIRPKKKIFAQYKSMNLKETEKIRNPVMKSFVITVLVVFCLWGIASKFMLGGRLWKSNEAKETNQIEQETSKSPESIPDSRYNDAPTPMPEQPISENSFYVKQLDVIRTIYNDYYVGILVVYENDIIPLSDYPYETFTRGRKIYAKIPNFSNHASSLQAPENAQAATTKKASGLAEPHEEVAVFVRDSNTVRR